MEDIRFFPASIQTRAMGADLPEDDDDKFWIRVQATNAELDLHNSIMDPETTLKNFEKEAKTKLGVALKDHHAYRSFGYGRSADAILTEKNTLMIDFYILKNMDYDGYGREFKTSEKLIRAVEHELVNQVSIGFFGAREICNLCQMPIRKYSWYDDYSPNREEKCSHRMGKKYDVGKGKMERATYTVYDAHLKEVSLVEFASNRKTSIDEKREMRSFMEELLMTDQEWIAKLRDVLGETDIRSTDEPDEVVTKLESEVSGLRAEVATQKDEIADLQVDAEDGKAYRQSRIDEGIKQGNRAYGDKFDEEFHREYYADLPLENLEKQIVNNKKLGDAALPAGRSTTDTHEPPPEKQQASVAQRKRRGRRR